MAKLIDSRSRPRAQARLHARGLQRAAERTTAREITDDTRIRETLPTIEYALRHKAKLILASHLGRPKGKAESEVQPAPVVDRLRMLLDQRARRDRSTWPSRPTASARSRRELSRQLESGQVLLLENLRFHPEEEANDPEFAKQLASPCATST